MCETLEKCHDCGAAPGEVHISGCDVERCSVCGRQWIACGCKGHDPQFARWTGLWPGYAEAQALGMDLNDFHAWDYSRYFFIKPPVRGKPKTTGRRFKIYVHGTGPECPRPWSAAFGPHGCIRDSRAEALAGVLEACAKQLNVEIIEGEAPYPPETYGLDWSFDE